MRQRWYVRAALVVAVGLGVMAGLARSQEPQTWIDRQPLTVIDQGLVPVPLTSGTAGGGLPLLPVDAQPPAHVPHHPVRNWCHDHIYSCWSHHNAYLCGSWKSECTFVFGSCREFFGEPCLAGPPPSPFPPGYPPPPGSEAAAAEAAANRGCAHCR
jgi:hypothetical protein